MGSASKAIHHMEHAATAPAHGATATKQPPLAMRIGATMAILGAMLALFNVTGSAARTELLGLYTQETNASLHVQASSTKYRIVETQLRQLQVLGRDSTGSAGDGAPSARTQEDLLRFVRLVRGYRAEREAAVAWVASFERPRTRLTSAIEHYEWAELFAELGIVGSSLALLFTSRKIWLATLATGGIGLVFFAFTFFPTTHLMHAAEGAIEHARLETEARASSNRLEEQEEEELLRPVESGVVPRAH